MDLSRRDFMKIFGVSLASLLLARCKRPEMPGVLSTPTEPFSTPMQTCYEPTMPPVATPTPGSISARERLRSCWLGFDELARKAAADSSQATPSSEDYRLQLSGDHRKALDELVAANEIPTAVADLVQEAYDEACYHVWRSSVPITCYITAGPLYKPESAAVLVQQSEILDQLASQGNVDPETLAKATTALEHDLAFYALSEEEVQALYARLAESGSPYPPFDNLELDPAPDAKTAARFLIDLLTGK
jgi:hypothetical protein